MKQRAQNPTGCKGENLIKNRERSKTICSLGLIFAFILLGIIIVTTMALAKYVIKDEKDIEVTLRDVRISENEIEIIPSSWTNENVTVSISTKKNGEVYYKINENGEWKKYEKNFEVEENCNIYTKIKYTDGESPETVKEVTNIDKIKPTVEMVNPKDPITPDIQEYTILAGETTTNISKKLIAKDEGGSGLKTLNYAYSQSNTTEPTTYEEFKNEATVIKSATGGNWYIWTKVLDNAGNRAEETKVSPAYNVGYQISYDANGGTGAPKEQRKVHGTELKISETIPTKTGYEFQGWATTNTATVAELKAGENYTTDKAVKLYAVWKKYKYLNTTTSKYYMKLSDALNEVKDKETIKAMDYAIETTAPTLATAKAITFDLNGQTVVMSNVTLTNNGTLTIAGTNGTLTGSGADTITNNGTLIKNTATEVASSATADYYVIKNNGTATISAGKLTSSYGGIYNGTSAKLSVTGGTFNTAHVNVNNYSTLNTEENPSVVIDGTTTSLTTTSGNVVANSESGLIHIKNGIMNMPATIATPTVINCKSGKIIISGGTIKMAGNNAAVFNGYNSGNGDGTIEIRGGTIESTVSNGIQVYEKSKLIMSGGSINSSGKGILQDGLASTTITGGSITSSGADAIMQLGTTSITITGGTITSNATGKSGLAVGNGTAKITGGKLIGKAFGIWCHDTVKTTVTLGENDGKVSITTPEISGTEWGIYIGTATVNFYDGIIKGAVGQSIKGSDVTETATNCVVVKTTSGSTETAVLGPSTPVITAKLDDANGATYTGGTWTNKSVWVQLKSASIGAGIKAFQWYENGAWTTRELTTNNNVGMITYTATRNETIRFRAIDNNGVISYETVLGIKIDKTAPAISSVTPATTWDYSNDVTINATDNESICAYAVTTTNTAPTEWIETTSQDLSKVQTKRENGASWARVFYHNNRRGTTLFANETEAKSVDTAYKFSTLGTLDNYKDSTGNWEFMLQYPKDLTGKYNRWKQTGNPATTTIANGDGSANAPGYSAVHIDWSQNYWGGLTKSTASQTFINGSVGYAWWQYAIGAYQAWNGGIPGPSNSVFQGTELWARIDTLTKTNKKTLTAKVGNLTTNGTYYVWVKDHLGNVSSKAVTTNKVDTTAPSVTITRTDYNTFSWKASDSQSGILGYAITTSNSAPTSWTTSGTLTSGTKDVGAAGTYYVWVKDNVGNIGSASITAYTMARSQGTGSTLTTRMDGTSASTGTPITSNAVVLSGTPVWAVATANTGYNTPVLKNGTSALTASGTKIIITANTTISSSATVNTPTITYDNNFLKNDWVTDSTTLSTWGCSVTTFNKKELIEDTSVKSGKIIKFTMNTGSGGPYRPNIMLTTGKTYTWSIYVKASRAMTFTDFGYERGGKTKTAVNLDDNWQRITCTFTAVDGNYNAMSFYGLSGGWKSGDVLEIHSFEIAEGNLNTTSTTKTYGNKLATLPTPTRNGYTFAGWYTAPTGGTKIETTTAVPPSNTTYYAHWTVIKPSAPVITAKLDNSSGASYTSGAWTNHNVWVQLKSATVGGGIKNYQWSEDGGSTWKTDSLTTASNTGTITFTSDRNKEIWFRALDNNNVESAVSKYIIRKDTAAPTVTFGTNGNTTAAKTASTKVTVTDGGSGVKASSLKYLWTTMSSGMGSGDFVGNHCGTFTSGGTVSLPSGIGGDVYLWILAEDNLGNRTIKNSNKFVVSNIAPEADISVSTTAWTAGNVTMTIKPYAPTVLYDSGYIVTTNRDFYRATFPTKSYGGTKFRVSGIVKAVTTADSAVTTGAGFSYKNTSNALAWPLPQNVTTGSVTTATAYSKIYTIPTDYKESLKVFFQIGITAGTAGYKVEYTNVKYEYFDYTKIKSVTVNGTAITLTNGVGTYTATANGTYNIVVTDIYGNSRTFTKSVTNIDRAAPTITSAEIKNVTPTGYDVYVYGVKDAGSGVNRVQFPTWTSANGQDDIQSDWVNSTAAKGTKQSDGTTWVYRVNTTAHKNESGTYYTHIYVYDNLGNSKNVSTHTITVPSVTVTYDNNYLTNDLYTNSVLVGSYGYATTAPKTKTTAEDLSAKYGRIVQLTMNAGTGGGPYLGGSRLTVGTTYTWSVYVKASREITLGLVGQEQGGRKSVKVTKNWQRITYTFKATDYTYNAFTFYDPSGGWKDGDILYVHSLEISKVGTLNTSTATKNYGNTLASLPAPTRTGYTFAGWYTAPTGGTKIATTTAVPSSNTTYYAHWTVNKYYLDLNGNCDGSSVGKINDYGTANVDINGVNDVAGVTDYYKQWPYGTQYAINKIAATTGHTYNGVASGSLTGTITGTTSVSLKFTTNKYNLTFQNVYNTFEVKILSSAGALKQTVNISSSSPTISNILYTDIIETSTTSVKQTVSGTAFTEVKCSNVPTRTGYTWNSSVKYTMGAENTKAYRWNGTGWYTDHNGDTQCTAFSRLASTNGYTVKLTIGWTANTYTVKYNGNGNTGGSTANSTHTYNVAKALTTNGFTKTNYSFAGWSTSNATTAQVYETAEYTASRASTTATGTYVTVKEYFIKAPFASGDIYQLDFDVKGSGKMTNFFYGNANYLQVAKTERSDGVTNTKADGGNDITLTSDYKHYTTKFTLGSTGTTTVDKRLLFRLETGAATAYVKNIRLIKIASSAKMYNNAQSISNLSATNGATVNLYAVWAPKRAQIKFMRNISSTDLVNASQSFTVGVSGQSFSAKGWTNTGYTLKGWSASKTATTASWTVTSGVADAWITESSPTRTIYAVWEANKYKVTLNNQGATTAGTTAYWYKYKKTTTVSGETIYYYTDEAMTASPMKGSKITIPTKTGYTFGGYYTATNGGGTMYVDANGVCKNNIYSNVAGNTTLYAKWTLNTYTISYNLAGGSVATANPTSYNVTSNTITLNNPTRKGYTFLGWTGSNDISSGLGGYTTSNPYNAAGRDHFFGNAFNVTAGSTYRVIVTAKRTKGTIGLKGGIWYTAYTSGTAYEGYDSFTLAETLSDGWARYYRDVKVPAGKTQGKIYIQLEQSSSSGFTTAWSVADLSVIPQTTTTTIPKGSAGNRSYRANWKVNTYTVAYYNGATKLGSSTHTYGTAKALTTMTALKGSQSGFSFYGWTTGTSTLTRTYTDGQSVNNLTSTNGGTITLYAIWKRTVTFYSGLSKATSKTETQYYNPKGGNYTVTCPTPAAISKWTTLGWRGDTSAADKLYSSGGTSTSSASAFYAVYSRTLTIAYNGNGSTSGSTASHTMTQYYNSNNSKSTPTTTLKANGFAKTGYSFNKWAQGSASGTTYAAGGTWGWSPEVSSTSTTMTMYATWYQNCYQNLSTNKYYLKLSDAVSAAATNQTIKVLVARTETTAPTVASGKAITIDTNGLTTTLDKVSLTNNGTLTVTGSGKITASDSYTITNNGTFTKTGTGTINNGSTTYWQAILNSEKATANINGGNVTGAYRSIWNNGTLNVAGGAVSATLAECVANNGTMTVSSGSVTATKGNAINCIGTSKLTVTGGTVSAASGYVGVNSSSSGDVVVEGGTISGSIGYQGTSNGGLCMLGGTISTGSISGATAAIKNTSSGAIKIYGGTVTTASSYSGGPAIIATGSGQMYAYPAGNYSISGLSKTYTTTGARIIGASAAIDTRGATSQITLYLGTGGTPSNTSPVIQGNSLGEGDAVIRGTADTVRVIYHTGKITGNKKSGNASGTYIYGMTPEVYNRASPHAGYKMSANGTTSSTIIVTLSKK